MKTFHTFTTPKSFEKWLQTKHSTCHPEMKYGGCLDYVTVGGILYTMHEYDSEGRTITWANKKKNRMLEMTTSNRYHNGYSDAKVEEYEASYMRTDISYAQ